MEWGEEGWTESPLPTRTPWKQCAFQNFSMKAEEKDLLPAPPIQKLLSIYEDGI